MQEGVGPAENREAAIALRRAELASRIQRRLAGRSGPVMRIIEEEPDED
jgi:hypothetical protein